MYVEVKIQEKMSFNSVSLKVAGFIDLEDMTLGNQKDVLTMLLFSCLCHYYTAGYNLLQFTQAETSKILMQVIIQLEQVGVKVLAFTSDGSQSNKAAYSYLGISGKRDQVRCSIPNPVDKIRIL